jgi:hypothetical protein
MPAHNIVVVCSGSHEKKVNLGEVFHRSFQVRSFQVFPGLSRSFQVFPGLSGRSRVTMAAVENGA